MFIFFLWVIGSIFLYVFLKRGGLKISTNWGSMEKELERLNGEVQRLSEENGRLSRMADDREVMEERILDYCAAYGKDATKAVCQPDGTQVELHFRNAVFFRVPVVIDQDSGMALCGICYDPDMDTPKGLDHGRHEGLQGIVDTDRYYPGENSSYLGLYGVTDTVVRRLQFEYGSACPDDVSLPGAPLMTERTDKRPA